MDADDLVGHAFIVLTDENGNRIVKGFYPEKHAPFADGEIGDDSRVYDNLVAGKLIGGIHTVNISESSLNNHYLC